MNILLIKQSKLSATFLFFIIAFFACQKEVSNNVDSSFLAQGSLKDSTGNCLHDSVVGTFYNSIQPDADTNYIEVGIAIKTPGSYRITTDLQNGFYFADSGYFNDATDTVIRLHAIGVPSSVTNTSFTIKFGNDVCYVDVPVLDSATKNIQPATGTWEFVGAGWPYSGNINQASQTLLPGDSLLVQLSGLDASADTMLSMRFIVPSTTIQPGEYYGDGVKFSFDDLANKSNIYAADSSIGFSGCTIVVHSYDPDTRILNATFGATVQSVFGGISDVWNGKLVVIFPK